MMDEERPNGMCLQCKDGIYCLEWCMGYRVACDRCGEIPGRYCPKYEYKQGSLRGKTVEMDKWGHPAPVDEQEIEMLQAEADAQHEAEDAAKEDDKP